MENKLFFSLSNVSISVFDKPIVKDITLALKPGSIHAIMGPNGSGKSSLAYAIAGHPSYTVSTGSGVLCAHDLFALSAHERARKGLFLAFQNPYEIPGVSVLSFLKEAYSAVKNAHISVADFTILLQERCAQVGLDESFLQRGVNEGFSGGEKKKLEIVQLLLLQPTVAILDEIDSGLDVDALKVVADGIALAQKENPDLIILLITHYQRILRFIKPDYVHIMNNGQIVASGDFSLAETVELHGYEGFKHGSSLISSLQ